MKKSRGQSQPGQSKKFLVSLWNNEREISLNFPLTWDLVECRMMGHDFPPLSDSQVKDAIIKPIGTSGIRALAEGKQKVVILFDDLARPTPASRILPFVLDELRAGGIRNDQIRLVCAYACHRPLVREEMIKKLGRDIVETYPVFNHNVYEHHVKMGETSYGTPVLINREVAGCDLKIGVGCLIPHFTAGYGGGAKILLPGVAAMESIIHNHVHLHNAYPEKVGLGKVKNNPRRVDMEEAARIAGLDFIVNAVVNHKKEILGVFAGDFIEAHREGVTYANSVYGTRNPGQFDLIILNSFPIEESPEKALWAAEASLREGGNAVLIWKNPEGLLPHYLVGTFGSDYGGKKWQKPGLLRLPKAKKLFIYADSLSEQERRWWGPEEKVIWYRDWHTLMESLLQIHGEGAKVAIYPYATLQCPIFPNDY